MKFIDLFCGIGGFHLAFHNLKLTCAAACEKDAAARKTYEHNFKSISPELFNKGLFLDDIEDVDESKLPDFDILCAGFPCQPFSQAGRKKGFEDEGRGTLFFDIVRIVKAKRPVALFLENVRGIVNHDNGQTLATIKSILEGLGYSFSIKIVKASDYGLPQHRPRAFMVCFDKTRLREGSPDFKFPKRTKLKFSMSDVWGGKCDREIGLTLRCGGRRSGVDDRRNWDGYRVDGGVKYLSPLEGKKMMGFPAHYEFPVTETQAMKQLGNSVAVDAIQVVGKRILKYIKRHTTCPDYQ